MRASEWIAPSALSLVVGLVGCGSEPIPPPPRYPSNAQAEKEQEEGQEKAAATEAEPGTEPEEGEKKGEAEKEEAPPPPVQVVAAERSPIEGDSPTLKLQRPKDGQRIGSDAVWMRTKLENWKLEEAPGKHVHVIVDNEPYIAVRDLDGRRNLAAIYEKARGEKLAKGSHTLRIFPSRDHHESVKKDTPFEVAVFHYKKKSDDFEFDEEAPLLTYSRPKGCYPAGERILLDFYLSNVDELSKDGWRVHYDVDDGKVGGDIVEWKPHYIENLPVGEHTIRLQLVDENGEVAEGAYNDTTRTIEVAESCKEGSGDKKAEGDDAESGDNDGETKSAEATEEGEAQDAEEQAEGDDTDEKTEGKAEKKSADDAKGSKAEGGGKGASEEDGA